MLRFFAFGPNSEVKRATHTGIAQLPNSALQGAPQQRPILHRRFLHFNLKRPGWQLAHYASRFVSAFAWHVPLQASDHAEH